MEKHIYSPLNPQAARALKEEIGKALTELASEEIIDKMYVIQEITNVFHEKFKKRVSETIGFIVKWSVKDGNQFLTFTNPKQLAEIIKHSIKTEIKKGNKFTTSFD